MLFLTLLSVTNLLALCIASPVAQKRTANYDLGCYLPAAVLGVPFISFNAMTVDVCRSFCAFQNTVYAGLTAGSTCTCANILTDITSLNLGCDAPCSGNAAQSCGGYNTFQNVYLVAGSNPVSQSVAATTTTHPAAATTRAIQATSVMSIPAAQISTSVVSTATITSGSTSSITVPGTSFPTPVRSSTSTNAAHADSSNSPATLSARSSLQISASSGSPTSAVSTPVQTAGNISGYTQTVSGLNAAANGNGYLNSYLTDDGYNITQCAQSCTAASLCAFFNIYQQQSGTTFSDVCVLWQYVQSGSDFNNFYNNGLPISYSAGYAKIISAVNPSTISAKPTTSTATRMTPSTATVTSNACSNVHTPSGFTAGFQCLNSAADGEGYLSSYVNSAATTYNQLVTDCATSCSLRTGCAFFNVYQESTRSNNICVLWNIVKDASAATNSYNNGIPVSNSNGYILSASSLPATTTENMAPSGTASSCTNALAAGYAVCFNGQRVSDGACVN